MKLTLYSSEIEEILAGCKQGAQCVQMLLDRYDCADDKDAFVAAVVHRLLAERARYRAAANLSARAT